MIQWIQIAQAVVMGLAMLLVWSLRAGIKSGRWLSAGDSQAAEITELKRRMERALSETSRLATEIQGVPELIRRECEGRYMPLHLSEERWTQTRIELREIEERVRETELALARMRT